MAVFLISEVPFLAQNGNVINYATIFNIFDVVHIPIHGMLTF